MVLSSPEQQSAPAPPRSPAPAVKKQPTSLLPAFEPLSSSPALPRPLKRARDEFEESRSYLTPVPTSSTAILSSSPTRGNRHQPALTRAPTGATGPTGTTASAANLSERAPLTAVPSIQLDVDGKPIHLGRSSLSSDFQLSSNRFISRVHVIVCYKPASSSLERDRVEIRCSGWNGMQIHCRSSVYDIKKGETFSSDLRDAEIMLDVHGSRVFVRWPEKPRLGPVSSDEDEDDEDEDEDDQASPSKKPRPMLRHSTPPSPSPAQTGVRPVSPVSPSPAGPVLLPSSPPLAQDRHEPVQIYEDPESPQPGTSEPSQATTQVISQGLTTSVESHPPPEELGQDFSDNDEENDPIVHSFGPFGANLLPRMASIQASGSPQPPTTSRTSKSVANASSTSANASTSTASASTAASTSKSPRAPLRENESPAQAADKSDFDVKEHVVNQLAFSRLSSTPLSTILSHLPRSAGVMSKTALKDCLEQIACVGKVTREGKDAAGKPLESEYYYIPEKDQDEHRKEAVVNDLMKPGLRACRKQHKQYYWRKPK